MLFSKLHILKRTSKEHTH